MLAGYAGPVAAMSFDPGRWRRCANLAPTLPRGLVGAMAPSAPGRPASVARIALRAATRCRARPHFLAYRVQDLPAALPLIARNICSACRC